MNNAHNISELAKRVMIGDVLIKQLLSILDAIERTKAPKLTREDEVIIWKCLVKGITRDEKIRERLITCLIKVYDRTCENAAKDFYTHVSKTISEADLCDLSKQSVLFFVSRYDIDSNKNKKKKRINASEFDPKKGPLEVYLKSMIKADLSECVNKDENRTGYDKKSAKKIEDFRNCYFSRHGRYPSDEETMEGTGFSERKYRSVTDVMEKQKTCSLDTKYEEYDDNNPLSSIFRELSLRVSSTEDIVLQKERSRIILNTLTRLKGKGIYFDIVIDLTDGMSVKAIANKYGISPYEVNEILGVIGEYFREAIDDYENNVKLEFMTFELKETIDVRDG